MRMAYPQEAGVADGEVFSREADVVVSSQTDLAVVEAHVEVSVEEGEARQLPELPIVLGVMFVSS